LTDHPLLAGLIGALEAATRRCMRCRYVDGELQECSECIGARDLISHARAALDDSDVVPF